ncbi:MAG: class I SAM-dependent methyltransferase [Pseudomonadota bacterium]
MTDSETWRALNRANWDERVDVHLKAESYSLESLRAGKGMLDPIGESELGGVDGLDIVHLQCHFGRDSLTLAQRGAQVTALDFSAPAIAAARDLAGELRLAERCQFVDSDLYAARQAIPRPAAFDRVFVTWGAINWLPDIAQWAEIVAWFLKPGGSLYLLEGHPAALVFDDDTQLANGLPGYFAPYLAREAIRIDDDRDYADSTARIANSVTCEWLHPLSDVINGLIEAGLRLDWLNEHDAVPWRMFEHLKKDKDGMYRWPDTPWPPLAYSLQASSPP